jgi:hypothetical protein
VTVFYRVGKAEFTSGAYSRTPPSFDTEEPASRIAAEYPRQRPVKVYYRPGSPEEGVLLPDVPPLDARWLIPAQTPALAGVVLYLAGLAKLIRLARAKRFVERNDPRPARIPTLGVLRESAGGRELRVHRRVWPAVLAAHAIAAGGIGAAAAALRWKSQAALSTEGLLYAAAACVCAAVVCGLLRGRTVALRMELDSERRVLTLEDRRGACELPYDDLVAWTVRWMPVRAGGPRSAEDLAPTLGVRTAAGGEATIHVFGPAAPWHVMGLVARATAEKLARLTGGQVELVPWEG